MITLFPARNVIDVFSRATLSPVEIAIRKRASRRIPKDTRCTTPGGAHVVTVIGDPDEHNRHPVRLELAGGQTRDFSLPAISLTPVSQSPTQNIGDPHCMEEYS